ncbi:MAG: Ig-like domain-containing protein [Bacillota bacterium]|nr:Ig-like domain-containing protein [Bacillota bacterium]
MIKKRSNKLKSVVLTLAMVMIFMLGLTITVNAAAGDTWTVQTSGVADNLNGVCFGGSTFVAVGANGTILTSSNGTSWTNRTATNFAATGGADLKAVCFGNGMFMAVGNGGKVITSQNGITWTAQTSADNDLVAVAYGNPYGNSTFVALGSNSTEGGYIYTSTDYGSSWDPPYFYSGFFLHGICYGNSQFVVVGDLDYFNFDTERGIVLVSPNGINWIDHSTAQSAQSFSSVCYGGIYVATDIESRILTSGDNTISWANLDWQNTNHPCFNAVCYGESTYVVVGSSGYIYKSNNGTGWNSVTSNTANMLNGVCYGNGTFVAVGNSGTILSSSGVVIPTVSSVTVPSNATYKVGDVLNFTVNFNKNVNVTGTPVLPFTLNTGGVVNASYVGGSGSPALVFRYTVASGNLDADGVTVGNAISLNSGTIKDTDGNDAILALNSVGSTTNVLVDGVVPTVSSVSAPSDGTYAIGQNMDYTVNFSKAVSVVSSGGTPYLTLTVGSSTVHAPYYSGSGTTSLTFRYKVTSSDSDPDGVALSSNITLNGGTIKDAAGNDATLTFTGSTATTVKVDGIAPDAPSALLSPASDSGKLNSDNITNDNTPTFSGTAEANSTVTILDGVTALGTATADINGDWTFTTSALTEGSHTITAKAKDAAGNTSPASSAVSITIDTIPPAIGGVTNNAKYNTNVAGIFTEGSGTLSENSGAATAYTSNTSITTEGSYVLTVTDDAGNSNSASFIIDKTAPAVTAVSSTASNGSYKAGATVNITIAFTEAVTVTGTPQLTLETGTTDRTLNYMSGSGTNTLTLIYTVQPGDTSSDLDYISTTALALNGGSIKDAAGNDAVLTLATPGTTGSIGANKSIVIDTIASTVNSVSVPSSGTYPSGSKLEFNVNFDENVNVTGTPYLALIIGNTTVQADYSAAGSTSSVLKFTYTISDGQTDTDGITVDSLNLNGGIINDTAGNAALLTLNSVGSTTDVYVDTTAPSTPTIITTAQTLNANSITITGTAEAGSTIIITGGASTTTGTATGGSYSISVNLTQDAVNTLVVKARDSVGNESTAVSVAITEDSTAPAVPVITTAAQNVNADSITITGTAEDSSTITITGGASTATGIATGGSYSISVNLTQDAVNTLVVKAKDAADNESTAASVAITEDSTAPAAPVITTTAQIVNANSITIAGTAEAGSIITITGGASTATGTATGGSYSISVSLTQDAVNTLVVKARDAVDNESTAASVAITEDSVVPTISVAAITLSDISSNSAKLTWTASSDNVTVGANLKYKVVYSTDDITTVVAAESATQAQNWTANITTLTVSGLTASTDYYFNILVEDQAGNKALYTSVTGKTTAAVTGGGSTSGTVSTVVEVNGTKQDAGTATTEVTSSGQSVTTIAVDDSKLTGLLNNSGEQPTVTLPCSGSDAVVGELNGQTVKNMEQKDATLEIKTDAVTYTLPASQINIDSISSQIGSQVELKDIKVSVKIAEPLADTVKVVEDTASKGNYHLVVKPIEFEISCTNGDKTILVSKFNGYVERTVAIPDGIDPNKITTGIVLNADGSFSHVPTQVVVINGKYYAKINSLTNSIYSVIYNPVTFTDVSNHWAKDAINDMGSRMVVYGVGNGMYVPDKSITRAEFAAIVVRALGLQRGTSESSFKDVRLTDWFNGYVDTATDYALIAGYNSKSFAPNDKITREQAMTILARAMKLVGMDVSLSDSETTALLARYTDGYDVSQYAKTSAALCIKTGIVTGSSKTTVSPKAYVTRAEVALMVQRLLQKSGLI